MTSPAGSTPAPDTGIYLHPQDLRLALATRTRSSDAQAAILTVAPILRPALGRNPHLSETAWRSLWDTPHPHRDPRTLVSRPLTDDQIDHVIDTTRDNTTLLYAAAHNTLSWAQESRLKPARGNAGDLLASARRARLTSSEQVPRAIAGGPDLDDVEHPVSVRGMHADQYSLELDKAITHLEEQLAGDGTPAWETLIVLLESDNDQKIDELLATTRALLTPDPPASGQRTAAAAASITLTALGDELYVTYMNSSTAARPGHVDALDDFPDENPARSHGPSDHWLVDLDDEDTVAAIAARHGVTLTRVSRTATRATCPLTGRSELIRALLNWPITYTSDLIAEAWLEHVNEHPNERHSLSVGARNDAAEVIAVRTRELLDSRHTPSSTASNLAGLLQDIPRRGDAGGEAPDVTRHLVLHVLNHGHEHEQAARALAALETHDTARRVNRSTAGRASDRGR